MAEIVPSMPIRTPLIDSRGMMTSPWEKFFRQLYLRAGAAIALSNLELETAIESGVNPLPQTTHAITGGQAATNLTGETYDSTAYTSAIVFAEFTRGTSVMVSRVFSLQYISGAWNIIDMVNGRRSSQTTAHGITLSMNGDQMRAAATAGDDGAVKIRKVLFATS